MGRWLMVAATAIAVVLLGGGAVSAEGSWLDGDLAPWNTAEMPIPAPPPGTDLPPFLAERCAEQARPAQTAEDQAVVDAGWTLFNSFEGGWGAMVVYALSGYDGMCRPLGFQTFVFVDGLFAGTIAPSPMNSRTDGTVSEVSLRSRGRSLSARFQRYADSDPLCCPSRNTQVDYRIDQTPDGPILVAARAVTSPNPQPNPPQPPVMAAVTGTVTYRERIALPPDSVLSVQLLDVSRADAPATVLAEDKRATGEYAPPYAFRLSYDPAVINQRASYAVRATITDQEGRLWFTTTQRYAVLTGGAGSEVDVLLTMVRRDGGTSAAPPPAAGLPGRIWAWQGTQFSNDTALTPPDPSVYTIEFLAAGIVRLRADCNRGSAGYTTEDARITITPGAITLIACPAGTLASDFLKQLSEVVTFVLKDGELFLDLPVDTGTMRFAPLA